MKVNREKFIAALENCAPGLSEREIIEQSSCYLLKDGMIYTYDDETACSYTSPLNGSFKGAVQSTPLRSVLGKLKETDIEINQIKSKLVIKGKGRSMGIAMQKKIELPIDSIEKPEKWKKLPDSFSTAIAFVKDCAGRDDANFELTCIHIHPKWIEACDNYQFARFKIEMKLERNVLVRQTAIKNIIDHEMKFFSETQNWIHFKNDTGLTMACRRYEDEYRDLSNIAKFTGTKISLPKGLKDAADRAEVFSMDNNKENHIRVDLTPGYVKLRGEGQYGWYQERKKITYDGKPISFMVQPQMLMQIVDQHSQFEVSNLALKAVIDNGVFVVSLSEPEEK